MTIEEIIRKTYEDLGHGVDEVIRRPDGSFSITFIGPYGVVSRRLRLLFLVDYENNQCEHKNVKSDSDSSTGCLGSDPA